MLSKTKVIFFQIKKDKEKLIKIIQTALYHFERKEKLLIQVQDDISAKFVNSLLWQYPKESFLPHAISNMPCDDFIVITKEKTNINKASYMFNLSQDLFDIDKSFRTIYDFDDHTSEIKQKKSKKRFELYKLANFHIESK